MPILHQLVPAVHGFFDTYTLPALLVLVLIEEAGLPIPIPSDTLLVLAGALALDHPVWFTLLALAGTCLAVLIGSSVLYTLMRHGGRRFFARYGKYLHLGPPRLARVERWFRHHHRHALVIGRLIPGMRIPTTALAGLTGLPYRRYLRGGAVAAGIWSVSYFGLGLLLRLEGPWLLGLVGPLVHPLVRVVPAPVLVLLLVLVVLSFLAGVLLVRRSRAAALEAAPEAAAAIAPPRVTSHRNRPAA